MKITAASIAIALTLVSSFPAIAATADQSYYAREQIMKRQAPTGNWTLNQDSEWSTDCGYATKTSSYSCKSSNGNTIADSLCIGTKPESTSVNKLNFEGCNNDWAIEGDYYISSGCNSSRDSKTTYARNVSCRRGSYIVSSSYCKGQKPQTNYSEVCEAKAYCNYYESGFSSPSAMPKDLSDWQKVYEGTGITVSGYNKQITSKHICNQIPNTKHCAVLENRATQNLEIYVSDKSTAKIQSAGSTEWWSYSCGSA